MDFGHSAVIAISLVMLVPQGKVIDHTQARRYVGKLITLEGPVAAVRTVSGGDIWLSLGKPYPGASVVIVIPASIGKTVGDFRDYEGATIRVTGVVAIAGYDVPGRSPDPTASRRVPQTPNTPSITLAEMSAIQVITPPPPP
jgi:hypothetical protein